MCYVWKEKFENKYTEDKKYRKVKDHCHYSREYRDAAQRICNLEGEHMPLGFSMPTISSFKSIENKHDVER